MFCLRLESQSSTPAMSAGLLLNTHAQETPAGKELQQLHEEAAQAAPLGVHLDLQLPAVQHRALACRAPSLAVHTST